MSVKVKVVKPFLDFKVGKVMKVNNAAYEQWKDCLNRIDFPEKKVKAATSQKDKK